MASDGQNSPVSETEDISSDFFDDFSKEEFIEGLSVIDSWDDGQKVTRIDSEKIDSVKDLRELITNNSEKRYDHQKLKALISKYKIDRRFKNKQSPINQSEHKRLLDIKPGSRRDPAKTNMAIRKDKEIKVKQYLAKHLEESNEDLRPPGTELDDYFEGVAKTVKKNIKASLTPEKQKLLRASPKSKPIRKRLSRSKSRSPYRRRRLSPSRRLSPMKRSRRLSPMKHSSRHSSPRYSPTYSNYQSHRLYKQQWQSVKHSSPKRRYTPIRRQRSRTPLSSSRRRLPNSTSRSTRRSHSLSPRWSPTPSLRRSIHRSPSHKEHFLYLDKPMSDFNSVTTEPYVAPGPPHWEMNTVPQEPPLQYSDVATYSYINNSASPYPGYSGQYEYGVPCSGSGVPIAAAPYDTDIFAQCTPLVQVPQPVPAPALPVSTPAVPIPAPVLPVPAPALVLTGPSVASVLTNTTTDVIIPASLTQTSSASSEITVKPAFDPLTQLLAEGKISKEDYLKLTPNKVLTRCYEAMNKLNKLQLPNRLVMPTHLGNEPKALAVSHCSPLKRQMTIEFQFTNANFAATEQRNKQLIDSIATAVGLQHVLRRKPTLKNTRETGVQTSHPSCVMCEIRESTGRRDVGTCVEREQLSRTTHTQVDEKELASTRTVFVPGGGVATSAPLSISHMTPAQLVSQLAARAKSLKDTEPTPHPQAYAQRSTAFHNYQDNYKYRY
ncbi:hypothetical protein EVAR_39768_1 [Eumeta japonica]|uniref:Uncharacterized protein n=1 Tax=Eumeta variegata TaxID=151549 RepID=A0A4C1X4X4_EUMVA|nr:hypothetical protein EVAR_39768_1 [Eumeta japonica]